MSEVQHRRVHPSLVAMGTLAEYLSNRLLREGWRLWAYTDQIIMECPRSGIFLVAIAQVADQESVWAIRPQGHGPIAVSVAFGKETVGGNVQVVEAALRFLSDQHSHIVCHGGDGS